MKIEKEFIKLNKKAIKNGDVPVSCIIIKDGKIISKSYNQREYKKNPLYHAEILAIIKASKKLKTWNLSDCKIYCSLKPCSMCLEVIKMAKIKEIYYILESEKIVNYKYKIIKYDTNIENNFKEEIKQFFIDKR
jgi:tRNA(adenine34) deaminase